MNADLKRFIREQYPFPIAHAHKKTLAFLDDDSQKLKCLIQTAETVLQFLALLVMAQLNLDLRHHRAPALGSGGMRLRDDLRQPSFGKWQGLLRDILKQYRSPQYRELLVIPELFDFYFKPSQGKKLPVQPVVNRVIDPLITLRNEFHHPGIPDSLIPTKVAEGTHWLEDLLIRLRFLGSYQLVFVQRIELRHDDSRAERLFSHDLIEMSGCFSTFDRQRWDSEVHLREGQIMLLGPEKRGRGLLLQPFVTFADQIPVPGVRDVFLLNGFESRRARYLSTQFGQELATDQFNWPKGDEHLEALGQFFDLLRRADTDDAEVELEWDGQAHLIPPARRAERSTEEVFKARYRPTAAAKQHVSPYKFLDYYEPEDADLFFGRDSEIRELQRKFHNARLLILHGESGTGKTSLIRAGLIPRLPSESYIPVYVRILHDPVRAIKEAMTRQLGVDRRHVDLPLVQFLDEETMHLSKTVVIVLDQFEEFFLRLPQQVQEQFHQELGACTAAAHLDVRILIALRDDYFSRLADFQDTIAEIFTHEMSLHRLTPAQALEAAVEPVRQVGLTIEPALVAQFKDGILPLLGGDAQGVEPPLLQIVCYALYQHAQDAGRTFIGMEDYRAIGNVHGALEQYLNKVLRQFGQRQAQVRAVLKALVTTEGTKRASFIEEIGLRIQTVDVDLPDGETLERFLRKLVHARLVRADEEVGRAQYELTHEFLIDKIQEWVTENEQQLVKVLDVVDRAYEAYRATNLLLGQEALDIIEPFQDELVLPPEKAAFLALSQQIMRKKRRGSRLKMGVLLLLVGLSIASVFSWRTYQKNRQLLQEQKVAFAHQLIAKAASAQNEQAAMLPRSVLLTVEAMRRFPSVEVDESLRRGLALLVRPAMHLPQGRTVKSVTFSPTSQYLAMTSWNHAAQVYEMPSGRQVIRLAHNIETIAFNSNSRYLVTTSSDGIVSVWQLTSDQEEAQHLRDIKAHSVAFDSDGLLVTATLDGTIRSWDMGTGWKHTRLPIETNFKDVMFSADGQYLVTSSGDSDIQVWQVDSGQQVARLPHQGDLYAIAFSLDGQYLATQNMNQTIEEWGEVRVWKISNREEVARLTHKKHVSGVAFSPDGKYLATASQEATVGLWKVDSGRQIAQLLHQGGVQAVAFSPDGQYLATASDDGTARLWELDSGREVARLTAEGIVTTVAFSPDGQYLVTTSGNHGVHVWEMGSIWAGIRLPHQDGVSAVAFSPDAQYLATGHQNGTVQVWEADSGRRVAQLLHDTSVSDITFSADGQYLTTASGDDVVRVWEVSTQREVLRLPHQDGVSAVAFSPDAQYLATGYQNGTVQVWEADSGRRMAQLLHDTSVSDITFSADGQYLATTSGDNVVRVWEVGTQRDVLRLPHQGGVSAVTFSPDGQYLATASNDNMVRVWEVSSGQETVHMLHEERAEIVVFGPEGQYLATASSDGAIRVWEVISGREIVHLPQQKNIKAIAFTPGGRHIASACETLDDRESHIQTRLWQMWPEDLMAEACARLSRNLTLEEWRQYLGDKPYRPTCSNLPVHSSVIQEMAAQGTALIREGDAQAASEAYTQGVQWVLETNDADVSNAICRSGSLSGVAPIVIPACERAVQLVPSQPGFHDSRGLARTLIGDYAGAIEDFSFYVRGAGGKEWIGDTRRETRKTWIEVLKAGQNPFDASTLEQLRSEQAQKDSRREGSKPGAQL